MTRPVLFDTNILIDWSKKYTESLVQISYWDDAAISIITWMELMAGTANGNEEADINRFLEDMKIATIQVNDKISAAAATIVAARRRASEKKGLQDALIQATAAETKRMLITRNAKDFKTYPVAHSVRAGNGDEGQRHQGETCKYSTPQPLLFKSVITMS